MATLPTEHTVKSGECLWGLARKYYGTGTKWPQIAAANNISTSKPTIYTGQKLKIPDENGTTGSSENNASTDMNKVKITSFGLMSTSETENELFATWDWDKESTTESYKYMWSYYKEVKVGSTTETKEFLESVGSNSVDKDYYAAARFCSYTIPDGAVKIRFRVKPIAKKETKNNKETSPWEAEWSEYSVYECKENALGTPGAPEPELDDSKTKLTAKLDLSDESTLEQLGTNTVQFQLEKNSKIVETTKIQTIDADSLSVSYEWNSLSPDSIYRVRCRSVDGGIYSPWSSWSSNIPTVPAAPKKGITTCKSIGSDKVYLEWDKVDSADAYEISYTTNPSYFDVSSETQSTSTDGAETRFYITGMRSGDEYFFRLRACNENGESEWTEIVSVILGTKPAAPTTWSSTTTATVGEEVKLYWIHNSEDQSSLSYSQLELETKYTDEHYVVIYDETSGTYTRTNTTVDAIDGTLVTNAYVGGTAPYKGLKVYSVTDENDVTTYYCEDAEIRTIEITGTRYLVVDNGDGTYTRTDTVTDATGKTLVQNKFTTEGQEIYSGTDSSDNTVYYCEDDYNVTQTYAIDTTGYSEGVTLRWRVRTAGIINVLGDWSTQRAIDIYKVPELGIKIMESLDGIEIGTIESFPFFISAIPSAGSQQPLGYHLEVKSNQSYETVDRLGNPVTVSEGETIYSKYFDTEYALSLVMSAGNIDLENEMSYDFVCTVTMNSGLTAEATKTVDVKWTESRHIPNAEISVDPDTYVAYIKPYCENRTTTRYIVNKNDETGIYEKSEESTVTVCPITTITCAATKYGRRYILSDDEIFVMSGKAVSGAVQDGYQIYYGTAGDADDDGNMSYYDTYYYNKLVAPNAVTTTGEQVLYGMASTGEYIYYCEIVTVTLVEGVTLSVYRREFDGSFTELTTGLENTYGTTIVDPHPALDFARYRIVATDTETGSVGYYDLPGYPTGCNAVIIQWDEAWSSFETSEEDALAQPPWSGSLLKLPYNIDVSDSCKPDVSLVKYVGREHPVSYYGTQLDFTASWSTTIDKQDKETVYALRRLQRWPGDVYVREPSGTGYWANVGVSFSQKHCETTIPVTLDITRVEGGM